MKKHDIKIYSTPTCHYCTEAKSYLKEKGIAFTEIDVGARKEMIKEMVEKSGQMGVPVIDIDGTIIVGFRQDLIDASLAK